MGSDRAPPRCRGHYVLVLRLDSGVVVRTGRRAWSLGPGYYIYVGSAHGPGGLGARLRRHLCGVRRRLHWHIDRFIEAGAEPLLAVAVCADEKLEEAVAARCASRCLLGAPGFGSSDSPRSPGHLYRCEGLSEAVRAALECATGASSQ